MQASGEAVQLAVPGVGQPGGEGIRRAGADNGTKAPGKVESITNRGQLVR